VLISQVGVETKGVVIKVFVAGATGALGKQLVPMLVINGHEVVGMTRTEAKREWLRRVGAAPVVADALDADAVRRAVDDAEPDVIVHQLTALPAKVNPRRFDRAFALTNRLRTEGTDHLLSAGQEVGVKRFVAQSNAAGYARTGGPVKREDDPFDDRPPPGPEGIAAIGHLEAAVTAAHWTDGIVRRFRDRWPTLRSAGNSPESPVGSRSLLGGFAARLVAQRGVVGGAQLIARTRCVRVGARDAEVELAQFVDHRRH
jgi:hypothetical protein